MPIESRDGAGDYRILVLTGDFRGGEENYAALRRAGHEALAASPFMALDCKRVTFFDSQTLGLLVELLRAAQARAGGLVLTGVTERVAKWFELSGLDRIFKMLPDEAELAARPAGGAPGHKEVLDSVDIECMVKELQGALGEADETGAPSAGGPVDEKMLTEIEKLLSAAEEERG